MNGASLFARTYVPRKEVHGAAEMCDMRSSLTYKLNVTVVRVSSSLATTAEPRHSFHFFFFLQTTHPSLSVGIRDV